MESETERFHIQKRQMFNDPEGNTVNPIDYISDLPESIISYILSLIPTKYAVRSSLLSRSWRHRWTRVTSLDFDYQWRHPSKSKRMIHGDGVGKMSFVKFVNMVFLKNTAESIQSFRLRWEAPNHGSITINRWLNTAIARNCRVLDLAISLSDGQGEDTDKDIESDPSDFYLPGSIYSCGTLEVLKLSGCFVIELSYVVCLPKLVVLELRSVFYESYKSPDSLSILLAGCPELQSLTIERVCFDCMRECKVSSPTLKRLRIHCDDDFQGQEDDDVFKLEIDAPALEYLYLHDTVTECFSIQGPTLVTEMDIHIAPWIRGAVAGLVCAFDHVKFLKLSAAAMKALGCATETLSSTSFGKITKLVVDFDSSQWSHLLDLIDRCIRLEVLNIQCLDDYRCWRRPMRLPRCLLSSLKHVTFISFDGIEEEMSLLEVFLNQGLVLETINLCSNGHEPIDYKKRFHILNKVSKLPRASASCKITDCAWFEDLGAVEWEEG